MATVILPTVASLRARFPEFASMPDAAFQFAIDEAARGVDGSWIQADIPIALTYLAGHYLFGEKQRIAAGTDDGRAIASESFGSEISFTYENSGNDAAAADDFKTTFYGQKYLRLLRANRPAIAII